MKETQYTHLLNKLSAIGIVKNDIDFEQMVFDVICKINGALIDIFNVTNKVQSDYMIIRKNVIYTRNNDIIAKLFMYVAHDNRYSCMNSFCVKCVIGNATVEITALDTIDIINVKVFKIVELLNKAIILRKLKGL